MFLTRYLCKLIGDYIRGFLKKLDSDSISLNLLGGSIELKNVEIDDSVMRYCRTFCPIERIVVESLRVKVPWLELYSKSCEVCLKGVFVVVSVPCDTDSDEYGDILKGRHKIVDLFDAFKQKPMSDAERERSNFFTRLKHIVLRNITLVIEDSLMWYEQNDGNAVGAMIGLQHLVCAPANATGDSGLLSDDLSNTHRVITLQGLSLLADSDTSGKIQHEPWHIMSLDSFKRLLKSGFEMRAISNGYTVKPSSGKLLSSLQYKNSRLSVGIRGAIHVGGVNFHFSNLAALIMIARGISSLYGTTDDYLRMRPTKRPSCAIPGSCVSWWKYIIHRVVSNTSSRTRKDTFNWEFYRNWKQLCEEYYNYYLLVLGAPWLFGHVVNAKRLGEARRSLSIEHLIQVRQEARYTLEQFRLTERVFPRHYGDTICDRSAEYSVAAVEVLQGSLDYSPMKGEISIYLAFPELPLVLWNNDMVTTVLFKNVSLQSVHAEGKHQTVLSTLAVSVCLGSSRYDCVEMIEIMGKSENKEGILISYVQGICDTELSVDLSSISIKYDKKIVERLLTAILMSELIDIVGAPGYPLKMNTKKTRGIKTKVGIRNAIVDFGEIEVCVEDLDIFPSLRCSELCINEASSPPFIIVTDFTVNSENDTTFVSGNSYIRGVLLSFYTMRGVLFDVFTSLKGLFPLLERGNASQTVEPKRVFEFTFPYFAIDFPGDNVQLQMPELVVRLTPGVNWLITVVCKQMCCDSLLSKMNMSIMISGGISDKWTSLSTHLTDSKANSIVSVTFDGGNIIMDSRFVSVLEFLNDLAWVMLVQPEEGIPIYRNESFKDPSIEVLALFGNVSFSVVGEPLCAWKFPFRLLCEGHNSLVMEIKRFCDTRMELSVTLGSRCSWDVNGYALMYPSKADAGTLRAVMKWEPPSVLDVVNPLTVLVTSVITSERSFTAYFPALQEWLRQFNEAGSPLYRLRSMGSRLHFGLRTSHGRLYSAGFWPQRNVVYVEAKNVVLLYFPWGKLSSNCVVDSEDEDEDEDEDENDDDDDTHVRIGVPLCRVTWSYDGLSRCMSTEVSVVTELPRVVKEPCDSSCNAFLHGNIVEMETRQQVLYGADEQRETNRIAIKGKQQMDDQNSSLGDDAENQKRIQFQQRVVVSFQELYHLWVIAGSFFSAVPVSPSPPVAVGPRRVRSIEMHIPPFVAFSQDLAIALVLWEGIDAEFHDGTYMITTTLLSLLCDGSLQADEKRYSAKLWESLESLKMDAAILEVTGERKTTGGRMMLANNSELSGALLSLGNIFLHLDEEILPLLSQQLTAVHILLSSAIPPIPPPSRTEAAVLSEESRAAFTVSLEEACFGFAWCSRINGLYGELHCNLLALTLTSVGVVTLGDGSVKLKWFNAPPPEGVMGPSILLFREAEEIVPLLESISFTTQTSGHDYPHIKVSPIHIKFSSLTYLHLVELLSYHLKVEANDTDVVEPAICVFASTADKEIEAVAGISSSSVTSRCNVNGDTSAPVSVRDAVAASTEAPNSRCFSVELVEFRFAVEVQRSGDTDDEMKPIVWVQFTNAAWQLLQGAASFMVEEVNCGCDSESQVLSIHGVEFSWLRTNDGVTNLAPEIVCTVESLAVTPTIPSLRRCFDQLIRAPAKEVDPLYWTTKHLSGSISGGVGVSRYNTVNRKMEVVTVDTKLWELKADLVLSRDGGSVLVFSSLNTNNILVEMNGHSIFVEPARKKGADTVMVVDGGLSLTFSGGSFVLPWFLSGKKHMRRVERLGEEVMLLPFMAVGEGSYVRCRNVRYTMSERRELQKQRSAASSSAHRQLWQLQAAIHSLAISVPSQLDQGTVQATLAIDARAYLHGGMMEQGDVTLENLTVVTRTSGVASATAAKSATTENTVLRPVSIHICISEGRDVAFAVGRIVVDATIGDVMLLGAISHEVTRLTHHIMSFRRSPAEREYDLRIQEIMGWKSVPLHADWEDDGDVRHAEDTQGGEPQRGKSTLSLATFSPFVEVTLSNVKYPLLQVTLSDVVWKETMFHTSRTTLLQNQNFYVRVYGKGRWDTVVPAKAVVAFEAVHSWSKRTRTRQLRLQCDTLVVYASQLLLSKIIHINRQWAELQTALLQNLNSGREMMSRKSSVCTSPSSATATHRFINTFSDVFYLFIGKNLDRGEIVPLPSSTAVDLVLPFNRADEVRLYLYPRYCIKLDEDGRHARNDVGLQRDMHYSHVVAGQLQYGHAVGLVVDDLLVVMSCVETEGAHGAVSTSLPMVGAESHGDDAAAPVSPDAHVPIGAVRRADEAGLVIVRIHSRVTLYNGSGMMLEMRQYLLGTPDETPLSDDFWIVPPNAEYPLSGTCSRVELRVLLNGGVYTTSLSTLSLESGVFLDLHPCGDVASRVERLNSSFPVSLFMALRRYVESGSIVVMLFPRITVLNHIGVPVKLSLWQEEQLNDGYGGKGNVDGGAGDSTRFGPNRRVGETSSLWRRWGKFNSSHRYMKIGEHESLAHRGTLAICQCSYRSSLTMSLSFTQTGGETVGTDEPVRVCDSLKKNVEKEPCLLHLHDSNGRRFYVQVSVLHRTIILSVGLWVVNLTEYPILLTDSFASRRLSAGQMQHTGIPPSQGVPFLIGCRPTDFRVVFLTLGLDGDWSDGIPTHLGSHGVVESPRPMAGFTHSCNYVVQFPHVQDGRPMVLLLTPRWVFVNNTNRRLKIYFGLSGMKKKVSEAAKTSSDKHAETSVEATTVSSVTLRPGEHSFSCIGTVVGNLVSFQDTLEDTVPSITSLSSGNARYTNISEFYEVHRTEPMSIDGPGHAVFNLWASLKQPERVPSVAYGALVTSAAPLSLSSPPSSSSSCSDSARISEDAAFVTGRLSVTVQHTDNVLAVVMNSIHATNMVIQNQTRGETIAVRQKGSPRRSIIPPCQNRFFLWEDYCTSPVISLHVVGCKGAWFEVNFSCGTCQVQRCFTSDVTEGALARFYVRAFTSRRDAQHVKILLTDEAVPLHASFDDAWHTSVGRTLSVPSVELVWLTEDRPGNGQRLVSVLLRDMQVQTLNADNTRTVSVLLRRMQVVDGGEGTALVLHRACLANPNAEEDHAGRILSWFWRGEEVPQHDFQAVYTDMMSASGVTRITELSCTLSPFAVNVSDHLVAALWRELRGLQSLLVADGGTMASARESLSSSVSRHAFAKGLVERIRKESDAAAIFIPTHGQGGAGVGPAFLFVDQAHFARVILFVTFTRHKPDPLWQMLGMYTLMIPKRFRGMEFSWPAFVLENKATTQGLLLSQVQRWLVDGAMRQWTKVTRIGKVVDKLKSGARARMELAGAPEPMLPRIHEDDEGEEEEEEEEEGVDED